MTELLAQLWLPTDLDTAQAHLEAALKSQGFGVLTFVDLQATLRAKLGVDWPGHRVVGACNPALAHRALQAEPRIALLLPCNITLEAADHGVRVTIPRPDALLAAHLDHAEVRAVAAEAQARLEAVAQALLAAVREPQATAA